MTLLSILLHFWLAFYLLPAPIKSTEQLLDQMHKKYRGKWASTLTFTQHNTHYAGDTVKDHSVWYEAIEFPDRFRIDFGLPSEGNALIFANDSAYNFKAGILKSKRQRSNNLILLSGGLYFLDKLAALQRLTDAGYNTAIFRQDVWQGRPVYVVGAAKDDLKTAQFWIDQQHFYLVRSISPTPDQHVQDAHFSKHRKTAGGWTETEVVFFQDGLKVQLEEYKDIKANLVLPEGLFEEQSFGKVHWMNQ